MCAVGFLSFFKVCAGRINYLKLSFIRNLLLSIIRSLFDAIFSHDVAKEGS